ncbi:hypothetical protein GUJ93_ZPchr0009g831 [Zizania palustris]|uniref:Uncharacterized protein n=1 Tax=Zizania palustris TaxID=103762 RepID=A0A8J5RMV9_ZIZPA|nr:hypothetical protein GUJ93_ZPchr0009g831 [Zizania palustris]
MLSKIKSLELGTLCLAWAELDKRWNGTLSMRSAQLWELSEQSCSSVTTPNSLSPGRAILDGLDQSGYPASFHHGITALSDACKDRKKHHCLSLTYAENHKRTTEQGSISMHTCSLDSNYDLLV